MAINFQVASAPAYGDMAFKNYSAATDIASGVAVKIDTTNVVQGTANATWGIVDTPGIVPVTADGDVVVGVTMETVKAGQSGRVRTVGMAPCLSDGAITAGAWVMAGATALKVGYAKAIGSAKSSLGIALNTTAADGDTVLVQLAYARNA